MTDNDTRAPVARRVLRAAVAAVVAVLLGTLMAVARQGGDEPPIRVRSGSMIFELVTTSAPGAKWTANGDGWSPSVGTSSGSLQVVVVKADGYDCSGAGPYAGNAVEVTYDKTTTVTVHRAGNGRTFLTPRSALDLVPGSNDTVLEHGADGSGSITSLVVRGGGRPTTCSPTSGAAKPQIEVLVCSWDPAKACK